MNCTDAHHALPMLPLLCRMTHNAASQEMAEASAITFPTSHHPS
jgi:hypothetical protein